MSFQIGDKVIHWTHGLGEIMCIEEKTISNQPTNCYVVNTQKLTIWLPIDDLPQHSLRVPTSPEEFVKLFDILTAPSEKLSNDRIQRKEQLMEQIKDGQLASICRVVRDLTQFGRSAKLNDQEKSILEHATNSLLTEWAYSLEIPFSQAQTALADLLKQ